MESEQRRIPMRHLSSALQRLKSRLTAHPLRLPLPAMLLAIGALAVLLFRHDDIGPMPGGTLWMQSAAEYRGIARQTYAMAGRQLRTALGDPRWTAYPPQIGRTGDLPPAVLLDIDETVLDNSPYQAQLILDHETYHYQTWDRWIGLAAAEAIPGSLDFARQAEQLGVALLLVSNRRCRRREAEGPACPQKRDTLNNLRRLGFAVRDEDLLLKHERPDWGSDKTPRYDALATRYRILLMLGDNLGDLVPAAKHDTTPATRREILGRQRDWWGERWFLLPNPSYGGWIHALQRADRATQLRGYCATAPAGTC